MKKQILTTIMMLAGLAHASYPAQEQIECLLSDGGEVKSILIESGKFKQNPDPNKPGVVVDNPGTLTLLGPRGVIEIANPSPGIAGMFNEYNFPEAFHYENDAKKPQRIKFETRQLGLIYITYVCNRPNAVFCEDRSGNMVDSARVAINIDGLRIFNFNGISLPLCKRRLLE